MRRVSREEPRGLLSEAGNLYACATPPPIPALIVDYAPTSASEAGAALKLLDVFFQNV